MTEADEMYSRLRATEDKALRNELGLVSHEKECAIRYGHINESVSSIRADLRKAAWGGVMIGVTALSFLIKLVFFP